MDQNRKKESRSMYLYTALIFVVALLLILLAFFGQTNVSKLGNRANEFATTAPVPTQAPPSQEEFARVSNMAAALDTENKTLKSGLETANSLIDAYYKATTGDYTEAQKTIDTIDATTLSESELQLYNDIKEELKEGERE